MTPEGIMLITICVIGFICLAPPAWVLLSSRSHGGAKFGWFLVTLFFSWLGLAVFLIVTQPDNKTQNQSRTNGLQISFALFLITIALAWLHRHNSQPGVPIGWAEILVYRALVVLTWPIAALDLPIVVLPLLNLIQGFAVVHLLRVLIKLKARKISPPNNTQRSPDVQRRRF